MSESESIVGPVWLCTLQPGWTCPCGLQLLPGYTGAELFHPFH